MNLLIFDLDGTLAVKYTDEILPGVYEKFKELGYDPKQGAIAHPMPNPYNITRAVAQPKGIRTCIATNQGGVGLREIIEARGKPNQSKLTLPTVELVYERLKTISYMLTGSYHEMQVQAAFNLVDRKTGKWAKPYIHGDDLEQWNPEFRKPNPGMLNYFLNYFQPETATYIGDRPEDKQAAAAAEIEFIHADTYFNRR